MATHKHIYIYENSIMKFTKYCLKRGREQMREGEVNIVEGRDFFSKYTVNICQIFTMKPPCIIIEY
jgi:hypothetical protein